LEDFSSDLSFHTQFKEPYFFNQKGEIKAAKEPIPVDISFLVEHKSFKPKNIRQQLSKYLANKASQEQAAGKTPIFTIAIVFYHGETKWEKMTAVSEQPHIPPAFHRFIQEFDYGLIDTDKMSDEQIMGMRWSPLVNMLLVFKHFKDKVYLTNELDKLFYVGESYKNSEEGRKFIKGLLAYYFKNTQLRPEERKTVIKKIPKVMQKEAMSTYDLIREEAQDELKVQQVKNFLLLHPEFEDSEIAIILGSDIELVRSIRADLKKRKIIA
jgi:hypothetical protein